MTLSHVFRKTMYWMPRYMTSTVQKSLRQGLNWSYGLRSPSIRSAAASPFRHLSRLYNLVNETARGGSYILSGAEAATGNPMRVGLTGLWEFGQRNSFLYFQALLFGDNPVQRVDCDTFPMRQLRRQAESLAGEVDLVVASGNPLLLWSPRAGEWASGPESLRMVFDYRPGESWQEVEQRLKGQKGNLKRLRKARYTYRVSHSDEDFTTFYYQYYLPMVKTRYKDYGDITSEPGLRRGFHSEGGLLLFVEDENGEAVSAELACIRHNVYFALLAGVRGGDYALVKQGALAAVYYFSLLHGYQSGCSRHDSGLCSPFSTDGVFQHKQLWGYEPLPNDWNPRALLLWAPRSAPAAVAWLDAHPFLPRFARWGGKAAQETYAKALEWERGSSDRGL